MPTESPFLYNLTLRPPSLHIQSLVGQFSGVKKKYELVLVTSTTLEVHVPDPDTGKVAKIVQQDAFGLIQCIDKMRFAGLQQDLLVITSDSGELTIAKLDKAQFVPIFRQPHSKNGFRRLTPGEYLCVEPRSRAVMLGALERNKFVYRIEEVEGQPRLSAPLQSVEKDVFTLQVCALDTGFENPVWAALEIEHQKMLNYYELDQGLNYVVKRGLPIYESANHLVPFPIGGVLVCCKGVLVYEGKTRMYLQLPQRGTHETVVVASCVHNLKKGVFFVLLQSSLGDLFKVDVEHDGTVQEMAVAYFDTIPVCNDFCILRSGFLFANVASGNSLFYQFEKLGDAGTLKSSRTEPDLNEAHSFEPQGLRNLALVDIMECLAPVTDCAVLQTKRATQLVALSHQHVKKLEYGIATSELVSSPLPLASTRIFSTSKQVSKNDDYLVLTSAPENRTLVLSIGEVVEEVAESGFVLDEQTLAVCQVGASSIVQVHRKGIRHIRHADQSVATTDWAADALVVHASANSTQVVVALENRQICYFEVGPDDQLSEYQDRLDVDSMVTAVAVVSAPSPVALVATADSTVQAVSLHPSSCLLVLSIQALSSTCGLLAVLPHGGKVYVHLGLKNGVYARVALDVASGRLSDTRLKYVGSRPVAVAPIVLAGEQALLILSSKVWVGFQSVAFKVRPLIGSRIDSGTSFFSEDIGAESVVGILGGSLSIFTVDNIHSDFVVRPIRVRYAPKKLLQDGNSPYFFVAQLQLNTAPVKEGVDEDYYAAFGHDHESGACASCVQLVNVETENVVETWAFSEYVHALALVKLGDRECFVVGDQHSIHVYLVTRTKGQPQLLFHLRTPVSGVPSAFCQFHGRLLAGIGPEIAAYELGQKQLLRKLLSSPGFLRRVNKLAHLEADMIVVGDASESVSYMQFDARQNQFVLFANDTMKRQTTTFSMLDKRTVIGGDKFGSVFVNRLPEHVAQLQTSVLSKFSDDFVGSRGGRLEKACDFYTQDIPVAFAKGSFVVGTESIIYAGLQGTVGILVPLQTFQEAQFLVKLENAMRKYTDPFEHDNLLGREQVRFRSYYNPPKNVIDGDFLELFGMLSLGNQIKLARELERTPGEIERKLHDLRNRAI